MPNIPRRRRRSAVTSFTIEQEAGQRSDSSRPCHIRNVVVLPQLNARD